MLILVGSHVLASCENKLTIVGDQKAEKQGYYKNAEQADEQGYYQNVEQADEQGYYKNAMTEQRGGPCKYLPSTNTTTRIREKVTPLINENKFTIQPFVSKAIISS